MNSWFPTFRSIGSGSGLFRSWWPWRTTTTQRQSLLRLIAAATEENLPLPPLLESWMLDERGVQRRRLVRLVKLLQAGRPLADAVEEVPGVLGDEGLLALRFDSQSGTRTTAVRRLLAETSVPSLAATPRIKRTIVYFCVLMPISLLLILFAQLKIIPVMARIFQEFGVEMPPVLAWSVSSWGTFSVAWWLGLLVAIAGLWWLLATHSGRPLRQALFGRLFRSEHELRSADVLQKLGIAVTAGRPIPGALSTLARYHYDPTIRQELLFVRNEVEQGAGVWNSLAGVGMLNGPEVKLLESAERIGNRDWILEQLVAAKRGRTTRRIQRATELVLPVLVLLMAGLVVFQALAVFQPLTQLINSLLRPPQVGDRHHVFFRNPSSTKLRPPRYQRAGGARLVHSA
jgi:type II secretory pathway component PulF